MIINYNRTSLNTLPIQRDKKLSQSERSLEELSWNDSLLFIIELSSLFLCSPSWPCPASWHVARATVHDVVTTIKVKIRISVLVSVQIPSWKSGKKGIPQSCRYFRSEECSVWSSRSTIRECRRVHVQALTWTYHGMSVCRVVLEFVQLILPTWLQVHLLFSRKRSARISSSSNQSANSLMVSR